MDIIDNGQGGLLKKRQILCVIPINFALKPIDNRAKYSVEDLDGSIEYGFGRIRIRNTAFLQYIYLVLTKVNLGMFYLVTSNK